MQYIGGRIIQYEHQESVIHKCVTSKRRVAETDVRRSANSSIVEHVLESYGA